MAELMGECKGRNRAIRDRKIIFSFAERHPWLSPTTGSNPDIVQKLPARTSSDNISLILRIVS
jgi:hypothetical protein